MFGGRGLFLGHAVTIRGRDMCGARAIRVYRSGRGGLDIDDTTTQELRDEDIRTVVPGTSATRAETEPDTMDGDGTDGDATDQKDGDAADQDATDSKDADGTDTGDM